MGAASAADAPASALIGAHVSQHWSDAVTSAEGQSPFGQVPPLVYETKPLLAHVAHSEPQQGSSVPTAKQVPFGQAFPVGVEYPFDSQYPASGGEPDVADDEQAAAPNQTTEATNSNREAPIISAPSRPS